MQSTEATSETRSDLIEQARRRADLTTSIAEATILRDLVETLTSERQATDQIVREETALLRHKYRGAMSAKGRAQQERDVAEAALATERDRADRLAVVLEELSVWSVDHGYPGTSDVTLHAILAKATV